jgi:hypothetical protein
MPYGETKTEASVSIAREWAARFPYRVATRRYPAPAVHRALVPPARSYPAMRYMALHALPRQRFGRPAARRAPPSCVAICSG